VSLSLRQPRPIATDPSVAWASIVPGGGVALLQASITLQTLNLEGGEQFGVTIVRRACEEPVRQIVLNCGTEGVIAAEKITNHLDRS
jgi:chaperonin GroEL